MLENQIFSNFGIFVPYLIGFLADMKKGKTHFLWVVNLYFSLDAQIYLSKQTKSVDL